MMCGLKFILAPVLGSGIAGAAAWGQGAHAAPPRGAPDGTTAHLATVATLSSASILPSQVLRVIEDRSLGNRWILCRDLEHPGGPARLLLVATAGQEAVADSPSGIVPGNGHVPVQAAPRLPQAVIHSGDRMVVEEHSAFADARLAGLALESGVPGDSLRIRLEIGGRVVRAVALAAGRALLLPEGEQAR